MNLTSLISSLIVSGSLGYLNYLILKSFDIINLNKNTKDEKTSILMLFGAMNYSVFLWIGNSWLKGISSGNFGQTALGIFWIFIFDLVATPLVIIPTIVGLKYVMNFIRSNWLAKSKTTSSYTRDDFFQEDSTQKIYIFDFNNNLLTCGYMSQVDNFDSENFDMSIVPFYDVTEECITFSEITKLAKDEDCHLLIDFKRRIKIYKFIN